MAKRNSLNGSRALPGDSGRGRVPPCVGDHEEVLPALARGLFETAPPDQVVEAEDSLPDGVDVLVRDWLVADAGRVIARDIGPLRELGPDAPGELGELRY